MKVCLTLPPYDLIRKGYSSKCRIRSGHLPPLGIGYLASVLMREGHDVVILDPSAMGLGFDETVDLIASQKPGVVGISAVTPNAREAYELAGRVKERLGLTVVMGGPHPTSFPERVFEESPHTDIIVLGEGEKTLPRLVRVLEEGGGLGSVAGIWWRSPSGSVVKNAPPEYYENLDEIPFPARRLYRNELYMPLPNQYKRLPATNMITSRGCPYARCLFCFQGGKFAPKYRRRSPRNVVDEVKWLVRDFGFREVAFWDDNFTVNAKWILEFCRLLGEEGLDVTWSCIGRVDTVTEEMLRRMGKCGCFSVYYGFESGNQDLLDKIGKGTTIEQMRNAVAWTHKAGIETRGSFMFALPGETPAKAEKNIDLAIELDLDSVQFMPFRPMKGTKFYATAESEGRELEYPEGGIHAVGYLPDGYASPRELSALVRKAYLKFYLRPHYILKTAGKVRSFSDVGKYLEGFRFLAGIVS